MTNRTVVSCLLIFLLYWIVGGCATRTSNNEAVPARSIILFVGDGMGSEHRKAARWARAGMAGVLAMDDMPVSGRAHTSTVDGTITDSAASGTALACGVKTHESIVGLDSASNVVVTILEQAKRRGKRVGLVTDTEITHATPATFAAHVTHRGMEQEIARQLLSAGVDVMLGGGENEFLPASSTGRYPSPGKRQDARDLVNESVSNGYTYVCDHASFSAIDVSVTDRLLGLFADEGMTRPFTPSLAEMTGKAIDILSRGPHGFFLMVEGGQIDWASHANDAANAIGDTVGFDEAVRVAMDYAKRDGTTLVIVTADHETGGMTVSESSSGLPDEDGPFTMLGGGRFYVNWSTTGHTLFDVPLTAYGPSSDMLSGTYENTFIHDVMLQALD